VLGCVALGPRHSRAGIAVADVQMAGWLAGWVVGGIEWRVQAPVVGVGEEHSNDDVAHCLPCQRRPSDGY
jgi:O-succinylbenzoate synthase